VGWERNARMKGESGNYAEAAQIMEKRLAWFEKRFGPDHPETAKVINYLAIQYQDQGLFGKAESYHLRALAIRERAVGQNRSDTANSLNNLSILYEAQGAFDKVEPFRLRALALVERDDKLDKGDKASLLSVALRNLAIFYMGQGLYAKAKPLIMRSLNITEHAFGKDHSDAVESLSLLASFYENQGEYAQAQEAYTRVLKANPFNVDAINSMAIAYFRQGAYAKTEEIFKDVIGLNEQFIVTECWGYPNLRCTPNDTHPDAILALANLARFYLARGSENKALPLFLRTMEATSKIRENTHPRIALILDSLAQAYQSKGVNSRAVPLYLRALELLERSQSSVALGADPVLIARISNNLSSLYIGQDDFEKAEPLLRRSIAIESRYLQRQLPLLPESVRRSEVRRLGDGWELAFNGFNGAVRSSGAADLALFSRLNRYGLLLEIEQKQALLSRSPGAPRQLADQIVALTNQLADVRIPLVIRQDLSTRRETLERELYRLLPLLQPKVIEASAVATLLPQGAVLVEFQRYEPLDTRTKQGLQRGAPQYLALVLSRGHTTQAINLGAASDIDPLIAKALQASQTSGSDPTEAWRQVNSRIFPARLLDILAGAKQWILAPDGELSRIPFTALPSPHETNRLLSETVNLRLISSGRSLVLQQPIRGVPASRPLVLADPDFGPTPSGSKGWRRLPATSREGLIIGELINGTLYQQGEATTSRLTSAQSPKVVHVASHGYFAGANSQMEPMARPPAAAGQVLSAIGSLPAAKEDPMLNSAIVLAGANRNRRPDPQSSLKPAAQDSDRLDDGYLTAKEASQLQLTGTELVVLSACETAAGMKESGEDLYGLQRALSVAGARTTLLSLWKVDDDATAYFMESYYKLLKQGKGRMEALLAVQKEFRTNPPVAAWEDYRYWAAWQIVGESGPIDGL